MYLQLEQHLKGWMDCSGCIDASPVALKLLWLLCSFCSLNVLLFLMLASVFFLSLSGLFIAALVFLMLVSGLFDAVLSWTLRIV